MLSNFQKIMVLILLQLKFLRDREINFPQVIFHQEVELGFGDIY